MAGAEKRPAQRLGLIAQPTAGAAGDVLIDRASEGPMLQLEAIESEDKDLPLRRGIEPGVDVVLFGTGEADHLTAGEHRLGARAAAAARRPADTDENVRPPPRGRARPALGRQLALSQICIATAATIRAERRARATAQPMMWSRLLRKVYIARIALRKSCHDLAS
jgi:hypothetical protein